MVFPSGDQAVSPTCRVMYRRCNERLSSPCSTSASGFAVICLGSVIDFGGTICEAATVLIQATITNRSRMAGLPQTRPTRHRTIAAVGWAPSVIEDVLGLESLPVTPDPVDDVVLLTRYISIWDPP